MKKTIHILYIICFLLIIVIPVIFINRTPNAVSDLDNRMLIEMPNIKDDGFGWKLETYLEDRIGFRTEMLTAYAELNSALFNQLVHPSYMYGKDGQIFVEIHKNIQYNDYHKLFAETVQKMQEYCEDRGIKFYFMFEPEKASVYRQYLPDGIHYDDSWVDQMLSYMEELGVNVVNNKELLIKKSEEKNVFNRKFDAYHWNDIGCYEGTNNLLRKIKEDVPEIELLPEGVMKEIEKTYLSQSRFTINEKILMYSIISEDGEDITFIGDDISNLYRDEIMISKEYDHFKYYINKSKEAQTLPRLLSFQGSYYNEDIKEKRFLASRASEYIAVHNYQNVLNLDYYCNLFHPDIVVFEVAEYTLSDDYFDSGKMHSLKWNPALKTDEIVIDKLPSEGQCSLIVDQFSKIDKVFALEDFSQYNIQYVYLIVDGTPYDMKKNESGQYTVSLMDGLVSKAKNLYLAFVDKDNQIKRLDFETTYRKSLLDNPKLSGGITKQRGQYTISTDAPGNSFDAVELMTIDAAGEIKVHKVAYEPGLYRGSFTHELPSGSYIIRLVANSKLRDENIDINAWLEEGKGYAFTFNVDSLEKQHIVVSDYSIMTETDKQKK